MGKWVNVDCVRYESDIDKRYPLNCTYGDICSTEVHSIYSKEKTSTTMVTCCKFFEKCTEYNSDHGDWVKCSLPNSIRFIKED